MLRQIRSTTIKAVTTSLVVLGTIEVTTHLPSEGRRSEVYHYVADKVVTPVIRTLLDPEAAHNLAIYTLENYGNLVPKFRPNATEASVSLSCQPFGKDKVSFPSCVGLAAGFDKDGRGIRALMDLGFGFVEIGSVTPKPQPGNLKPRVYRLSQDLAIVNRLGFNSAGLDAVEGNIKSFLHLNNNVISLATTELETKGSDKSSNSIEMKILKMVQNGLINTVEAVVEFTISLLSATTLPFHQGETMGGVLGVNLGKNKDSTDETADYEQGIRQLGPYADYIVVNISSPNTPGLRELQKRDPLCRLLTAAIAERNAIPLQTFPNGKIVRGEEIPLLVKFAPDLTLEEMEDIAKVVLECKVDGMIISNTSSQRPYTLFSKYRSEEGGLSGAPIRDLSTKTIRTMYRLTNGNVPIIGVGGIGSGRHAYDKLKAGASLVQVYSAMIYEGPGVVSRIRKELAEILLENGQKSVENDVVGLDHENIFWRKREERRKRKLSLEKYIVEDNLPDKPVEDIEKEFYKV